MSGGSIPLLPDEGLLPFVPGIVGDTEFAALPVVGTETVAAVLAHGYIPMTMGDEGPDVLLVKCHRERMVLEWTDLHLPRKTLRYARGLNLVIGREPGTVIDRVHEAHADSWLNDALREALAGLARNRLPAVSGGAAVPPGPRVVTPELYLAAHPGAPVPTASTAGEAIAAPVAGELGVLCGRVYTSLSGYHRRNGAGWALMGALAGVLQDAGVAFWDLGMPIDYKYRLGARVCDRDTFLKRFRAAAQAPAPTLPSASVVFSARDLVDRVRTQRSGSEPGMA